MPDAIADVGTSTADRAPNVDAAEAGPPDVAPGEVDAGSDAPGGGSFMPAEHPAWPQVPLMAQGSVLRPMRLVPIVVQGETLSSALFGFADALVSSSWWAAVGSDYRLGAPVPSAVHVTGGAIPQSSGRADPQNPGRADMESYIENLIQANTAPTPDDHTLYILFLPAGVVAYDEASGTSNANCQLYTGYHSAFETFMAADGGVRGVAWGFAQRCGATQGVSDQDRLTLTASHEIIEAATDPLPGYGWSQEGPGPATPPPWTQSPYAVLGGEVADLCTGTQISEGGYLFSRVWSNTAAMGQGDPCVPALAGVVYVNASAPQPWYKVAAGASVQIPLTGFSEAPAQDWLLYASVGAGNDAAGRLQATISAATSVTTTLGPTATTNNGRGATLAVNAAAGTPSGTWSLIEVTSQPMAAGGGDPIHFWPVGVYVP